MRILLVQEERYLPAYTGSSKSSRSLLEGLVNTGHDCLAISPLRLKGISEDDFLQSMEQRNIQISHVAQNLYHCEYNSVSVRSMPMEEGSVNGIKDRISWLRKQFKEYQPDIVIVSADPRYYLLKTFSTLCPEKVVFIVHSHEHLPFGPLSRKKSEEQSDVIKQASLIISVSQYSRAYIKEWGNVNSHVLSFPVYDIASIEKNNFEKRYISLINGGLEKGVDIFIELLAKNPDEAFAIIDWNIEPLVKERLEQHKNITFLAPVDDIRDVIKQTKILLMPSVFPETFGLSVVEAMSQGIPVIASNLGGLPEAKLGIPRLLDVNPIQIVEGDFVSVDQKTEPWQEALTKLISDASYYNDIAQRSIDAASRFISELSIRPFEDIFKPLVKQKHKVMVAITDAYDAGYLLAEEVQRRGYRCINIDSSNNVHEEIRAKCEWGKFDAIVEHRGNIQNTLDQLNSLKVDFILPGNETGVMLSDQLSERLNFRGNDPQSSQYRRNKYLMAQAAKSSGVNIPSQACSGEFREITTWRTLHGKWPVVIKPPHSIASEDVYVCRNEKELEKSFFKVLGKRNLTGLINNSVIVEELLFGEQYVLDTVSCDGQHFLAGVWHYGRPSWAEDVLSTVLYNKPWPKELAHVNWNDMNYAAVGSNSKEFLTGDDALAETLFNYSVSVLDSIGVKNGPAHFELMWIDGEPLLVEVGARLHGAPSTHWMCRICGGFSQLDYAIDAYLQPEFFMKNASTQYRLKYHGWKFRFHPWRAGKFNGFKGLKRIENLPSFRGFYYMSGGKIIKPKDCVGVVALIHPDRDVLLNDVQTIHQWEKQDLFEIEAHQLTEQ